MEYSDSSEPRVVYENGVPYLADQNMNPVIDSMGEKIISYSRIIDDRKEAHKKEKKAWYQRWIFCCCK